MNTFSLFVLTFCIVYIIKCQEVDSVDSELKQGLQFEIDDDPLMAPVGNDIQEERQTDSELDTLQSLPGMEDLMRDSENVLMEERSRVRAAIHHEQAAILEAGVSDEDHKLEKQIDLLEYSTTTIIDYQEPIFNTDDFDDPWDDML